MLSNGNVAVAIVQCQVMVVQDKYFNEIFCISHPRRRDRYLDVHTYTPFGGRIFLSSPVPHARIAPSDILTIFPPTDKVNVPEEGILELPQQAFSEFTELNFRHQKRCESMWNAWASSH
ncbi:hypothetical protein C0995_008523 [Termitomyces sp. Mi166|nr:hypothetical protein C0995_008523 [Termitomyces sp. Mi166\